MKKIITKQEYIDDVVKCKNNMKYIYFTPKELEKIDSFANQIIQVKQQEKHHKKDNNKEYERFFTGTMGECAVEKLLGQSFVDWSIGNSNKYNIADLNALGLNIGVKTIEMYNYPLIHKKAERPEIICIKRKDDLIIVCGLATIEILNTYQDDNLILSPSVRKRGTKTGFYGFEHLIGFSTLEELKQYSV